MAGLEYLCVGVLLTLLAPHVYGTKVEQKQLGQQQLGPKDGSGVQQELTQQLSSENKEELDQEPLHQLVQGFDLPEEELQRLEGEEEDREPRHQEDREPHIQVFRPSDATKVEQELRHHLLQGYDKHTRPQPTTVVKFRISLKHFDMVEAEQSLMVDSWIVNNWNDPRLGWHPEEFLNITNLFFPSDSLWTPDLELYNSARAGEGMRIGQALLTVFNNGQVIYTPSVRLHFSCVMDLTLWPHDTHNCSAVIGSWVHDGFAIDPQLMDEKPELNMMSRVGEDGRNLTRGSWHLLDANLTRNEEKYACCPAPYVTIQISLLLTRYAPAYAWIIKLPAVGLSLLTFVLFLLPPGAGEKLIFGGLCLILDVFFIAFTSHVVAHAPSHTPLIVQLVSKQLMLIIASLVVVAVTTRLARVPHTSGLPGCVKRPLLLLSTCLCLQNYRNLVSKSQQPYTRTMKTEEMELGENGAAHMYHGDLNTTSSLDWLLLAAFIDRVCLIIFLAIFIINMLTFRSVL
ncbi:neuronal acetylcholine receptor subunit alpha-5-like [Panulirus ornatus]|uniref:neuronal acetylcholine receptor subunit alpha-5-like n=1 Tax=Panulirus ornatus TaxID=150431 RepID=UPI003A842E7F